MRILLRHIIALVVTYPIAWVLAYVLMFWSRDDSIDLRHCWPYFEMFWSGNAGELPFFIGILSILIVFPLAGFGLWLTRGRGKRT